MLRKTKILVTIIASGISMTSATLLSAMPQEQHAFNPQGSGECGVPAFGGCVSSCAAAISEFGSIGAACDWGLWEVCSNAEELAVVSAECGNAGPQCGGGEGITCWFPE